MAKSGMIHWQGRNYDVPNYIRFERAEGICPYLKVESYVFNKKAGHY